MEPKGLLPGAGTAATVATLLRARVSKGRSVARVVSRTGSLVAVAIASVCLLATDGWAETGPAVVPGMLIRVAAPEQSREPVVGTLIECSADTIVLAQAKHGRRVTFRPDGITRIDWSPRERRRTIEGAGLGAALVGALAVADTLAGAGARRSARDLSSGIASGAAIGALVGAMRHTRDWRPARLDLAETPRVERTQPPTPADAERAASPAAAADPRLPALGTRVRVLAPALARRPIAGSLARIDDESLVVLSPDGTPTRIPRGGVVRLETSRGSRRYPLEGMAIGAGVFGMAGGISGCAPMVGCSGPSWGVGAAWAVLGAVQGVIAGAVVRREEWTNTPLDHVRVSALVAGRGRVGAAVTIGF